MIRVRFVSADGVRVTEADAAPGAHLLEVAQVNGQPLEGVCEGAMACSTCHVLVAAADFDRLPPASEHEEDMLDFAVGVSRTSRLACQIELTEALGSIEVRMPSGHANMQGR